MSSFHFYWPWMALLLLAPVVIRWLAPPAAEPREHGQRVTLLHPSLQRLSLAFGGRHPRPPVSVRARLLLLSLAWIAFTLAMMRPQWLEPRTETRTEGYDLMVAVDASHSMAALDFSSEGRQVSRMQVVKGVMGRFVDARAGDRIGLVIFGSQAYTLSPLTVDRASVHRLLDEVVTRIAGDGTAIGDAIGVGVKRLRERPEGSRVLVLITDGENSAGTLPPLEAARLAAREGVRIHAIGVGSYQDEIPIMEGGRLIVRTDLGFDEETLQRIADITGGVYFRATDTSALEEISRRIDELTKTESESRTLLVPHPLFHWPLAVGMLALLGVALLPGGPDLGWKRARA